MVAAVPPNAPRKVQANAQTPPRARIVTATIRVAIAEQMQPVASASDAVSIWARRPLLTDTFFGRENRVGGGYLK